MTNELKTHFINKYKKLPIKWWQLGNILLFVIFVVFSGITKKQRLHCALLDAPKKIKKPSTTFTSSLTTDFYLLLK